MGLKVRRSWDRLIFNMGIPILVRRYLYTDTSPGLDKADDNLQTSFSNAFPEFGNLDQNIIELCSWWSFFFISQSCCRHWLGAEQSINHSLYQWWQGLPRLNGFHGPQNNKSGIMTAILFEYIHLHAEVSYVAWWAWRQSKTEHTSLLYVYEYICQMLYHYPTEWSFLLWRHTVWSEVSMTLLAPAVSDFDRWQSSWGHHGAHLGPVVPRWAPCWPMNLAIIQGCTWQVPRYNV